MKRFAPILLSYCLLLTVVGSCKKPAVDEPEPNLANCRIVKETYQVGWRPQDTVKKETVQVNGKSYDVMFARESTFSYDAQGRIIKEEYKPAPYFTPGIDYTVTYTYTSTAIYKSTIWSSGNSRDTIVLNSEGLNSIDANGLFPSYDSEGYLKYAASKSGGRKTEWTRDTLKNAIKVQTLDPYEARTQILVYDLTKKNLPYKYLFRGKAGPNLPIRESYYVNGSTAFPIGLLFTINRYYTFDKYERVIREIAIETHHVPPQQYGQYIYAGGIGVTDYQYDCH